MIENHMVQGDPEAGTYDPEPYRARALDDVIETIMLFGQWPQPRTGKGWHMAAKPSAQFSLVDWLIENEEPCDLAAFVVRQIMLDDERDVWQNRMEKRITEKLRAELSDSEMVNDHIDELRRDEMENT